MATRQSSKHSRSVSREALIRIYERLRGEPIDATQTEETGIPGLDKALSLVGSMGRARGLLLELILLRDTAEGGISKAQVDRMAQLQEADKHLRRAANALRESGSCRLADLTEDIAYGAHEAIFGHTYMQPINIPPDARRPEQFADMRLYPVCYPKHPVLLREVKVKGRSKADPSSAANGAAVRILAKYLADDVPHRSPIIARLCSMVGYPVTAPTVRRILDGYQPKEDVSQDGQAALWHQVLSR